MSPIRTDSSAGLAPSPGGGAGAGTLSDEAVVERVRAGESPLFEVLMRRHNARLYRAVRSVLRDEDDVEDVMQQAWLAAFAHLAQFQGAARFSTWLIKIALHEAFARVRKQRRLVSIADDEAITERAGEAGPPPPRTPEQRVVDHEVLAVIESAVDALPDTYRTIFMLREVDGRSTAEVAECLDVSEDVVKTRLHRGRALLRDRVLRRFGSAAIQAFGFDAVRCDRVVAAVMARIG